MTEPSETELSAGKVAGCACIGAQLATVAGQSLTNGANDTATDAQPTPLKAASLLILQRNSQRPQDATKNDGMWITQQKQRNFDPENTGEKLRPVAPVAGRLRAEIPSADPIAEAAHAHGIDPERLRAEHTEDDIRAIEDDLPDERKALWVFASIITKQICMEREEAFHERAAIREYDGRQSRADAEEAAAREVYCRDCAHWTADSLNPDMGLGKCSVRKPGTLPLPWPGATCWKAAEARP